ncbi:MAG: peptidase [Deltaproteobacteria bacterium]|nr:peptidase [Deltaproteobacteria bacterium]
MVRKSRVVALLIAAVAAGVLITAALDLSPITDAFWGEKVKTAAGAPAAVPAAAQKPEATGVRMLPVDIPGLVKGVSPAVVNISTTQVVRYNRPQFRSPFGRQDPFEEFFHNFFGNMPREQKRRSLGSGFIVSDDGYILTNSHVVEKADEVTVTLLDKEELKAKVVGTDPKTDIALIKISSKKKLPHVDLGNSEALEVGEWVVAIGNPFGLGHTVTAGIVSAKGRIIGSGPYDDFIQTDASINPGNSGGPLFNLKGEVVGINTAIVQGGQGIGFATPIQLAKSILGQLKDKGKVTRGWLGVYIQPLSAELAENLGVKERQGALVSDVTKDGPAEKAGIRSGDLIVSFNGKDVRDEHELPALVAAVRPGTKVNVKIIREGKEQSIPVTIAEMEAEPALRASADTELSKGVGLTVQEITPEIAKRLDIANAKGVLVTSVGGGTAADEAGFQEGDIIRQVNGQPVPNAAEFSKLMKKHKGDKTIRFLVERGEIRLILAMSMK